MTLTSTSGPPPLTAATANYRDVVINFHGVQGVDPLQASAGILSYDILVYHGPADPGRLRSAGWVLMKSIPYSDADIVGDIFTIPCPSMVDDTYLAVGVRFKGGADGVPSVLVGRSQAIECDPNLAEPNGPIDLDRPRIRPHRTRINSGRR